MSLATLSNVSCKRKEKLHDSRMQEPSTIFDVDGEASGSDKFSIPAIRILGTEKAQLIRKVPRSDPISGRYGRNKDPVQRLMLCGF